VASGQHQREQQQQQQRQQQTQRSSSSRSSGVDSYGTAVGTSATSDHSYSSAGRGIASYMSSRFAVLTGGATGKIALFETFA